MSDLMEFLLARIAEDEVAAKRGVAEITADPYAWTDFPSGEFDPTRVLHECEAKRQILGRHGDEASEQDCSPCWWHDASYCPTVLAFATVYADHPDYRSEWND